MYKLLLAQFFILNHSPSCCKLSLAVKSSESLGLIRVESWTWNCWHLSKAGVMPGNQPDAPGHCKWWDTQRDGPRRAKHITDSHHRSMTINGRSFPANRLCSVPGAGANRRNGSLIQIGEQNGSLTRKSSQSTLAVHTQGLCVLQAGLLSLQVLPFWDGHPEPLLHQLVIPNILDFTCSCRVFQSVAEIKIPHETLPLQICILLNVNRINVLYLLPEMGGEGVVVVV